MTITPYLYYEDVDRALDFLGRAFGFEPFDEVARTAEGVANHAAMKRGDDVIMMGWPGPDYRGPGRLGQATFGVYVTVEDADRHFACAKAAGAKIIEQLHVTHYGARRYGAEDPEGHQWYFAQTSAPDG